MIKILKKSVLIILSVLLMTHACMQITFAEDTGPVGDGAKVEAESTTDTSGSTASTTDPGVNAPNPNAEKAVNLESDNTIKGVRVDNRYKPINAPDAINQNYGITTVNAFLQFLGGSIMEIISGIAIFTLVVAGYMMVTAAGNEEQVTRGKDILKKTVTGLIVIVLSYVIVKAVLSLILEVNTY